MQTLRWHKETFVISGLLFVGIMAGRTIYQSQYSLICSSYQIHSDKIDTSIQILQLTDLHNCEFGENNQKLIDRLANQTPDLILLTGDLLDSDEPKTDIADKTISCI